MHVLHLLILTTAMKDRNKSRHVGFKHARRNGEGLVDGYVSLDMGRGCKRRGIWEFLLRSGLGACVTHGEY